MIKPGALKKGDCVAVVSLSSGMGGDPLFLHRYELGKRRLEGIFGLHVQPMPNALKGSEYLFRHPEARAEDLMNAFQDDQIRAVISMIGGDDAIRLTPYIDFTVLRNNPKIFMGYSDTTANHFMMQKAGLVSFYGPCVMVEFAENGGMHPYTKTAIEKMLFSSASNIQILPSEFWTSELLDWANEENNLIARKLTCDDKGHELLQGEGVVCGSLIGGCTTILQMLIGTSLWPDPESWNDKILFLETAEDCPTPDSLRYFLRNLAAQGILSKLNALVIGKPLGEQYYEEYKQVYRSVLQEENGLYSLPVLYNMTFGHNAPTAILPYGIAAKLDCGKKSLTLLESPVLP